MSTVYNRVEAFYAKNIKTFEQLEEDFFKSYKIPKEIVRDSIKRLLVESFDDGRKQHLLKYKKSFKKFILYYVVVGYFILLSILGKRRISKEREYDILLEDWTLNGFAEFYQRIYQKFALYKIDIFVNAKKYSRTFYPKECDLVVRQSVHKHYYSSTISQKIVYNQFGKFLLYHQLSQDSNIDIINISLRLIRYIAVYETDILGLKSKFLMSAADNYYGALRYYIYKKNIENIVLIQNGYRAGSISNNGGDMYTYCDYYLGFGYKNIEIQEGMVCTNKLPIGSLRLYDRVDQLFIEKEIKWDVVFIEQLALLKTANFNVDTYMKIIDFLCQFSKKYPQYKINYRVRPKRMEHYAATQPMKLHIENIDSRLEDANITIDENLSKNSYEAILSSNVVLFFTSTMGIEALGLDKKVFNCNLDKQNFCLSLENEMGVLVDDSYTLFEEKLLYLLNNNNDNDKISKYFLDKKLQYMNLDGDPVEKIVEIVKEKITND